MAIINPKYNRFLQAFLYLMLISAALHICIAFTHFFVSGDVTSFNFFRIIELSIFYPDFVDSIMGQYFAVVATLFVYLTAFIFLAKGKK